MPTRADSKRSRGQAPFELNEATVIREFASNDQMLQAAGNSDQAYFRAGHAALESIEAAMEALPPTYPVPKIERILDLPCGHGRVLRYLRAAFPEAEITACEMKKDAVDFCAVTFDAIPLYSNEDPEKIGLEGKYDLIWCGSLFTHLKLELWMAFLDLFHDHLAENGLFVFTAHGRRVADSLRRGVDSLDLKPEQISQLLTEYEQGGFAYQRYPHLTLPDDYGVSLASPSWVVDAVLDRPDWRLVAYTEMGWVSFQDTISCIKRRIDGLVTAEDCTELGWEPSS